MIRSAVLCNVFLCATLIAQSAPLNPSSNKPSSTGTQTSAVGAKSAANPTPVHYRPERFAGRAGQYYRLIWGIDSLSVKSAESGEMIRFTYRVIDANKAKTLLDKKLEPSLVDAQAHVKLVVPMMDKVGKLRQTAPPEAGKTYWMLFSNKGGYVKRGDHVDVLIGNFHADGLVVD
jgi:hypothetical protein